MRVPIILLQCGGRGQTAGRIIGAINCAGVEFVDENGGQGVQRKTRKPQSIYVCIILKSMISAIASPRKLLPPKVRRTE